MVEDATALMERYCDGDASAFRALYALTAPRILAYLMCLVRDRAAAEELLQQTFIKLHVSRDSYLRGADPIPWMFTIAHRTCLDEFRRLRRSRTEGALAPALGTFARLDGGPEGSRPAYDEKMIAAALEALEKLPETQRLAVMLTKIQGKTMAEAASILGTSPGAVKVRAHRGYVMLREILRGLEEEA
jgi:RNA polymerase sigma factor (sigma-70 family)